MQIAYITRGMSSHDLRFLEAIERRGSEAVVVSLQLDTPSLKRQCPLGTAHRGLALGPNPSTTDLDAAARALETWAPLRAAALVHAGPVTDAAYVAIRATSRPVVAVSWGFDLLMEVDQDTAAASRATLALGVCAGFLADCRTVLQRARVRGLPAGTPVAVLPWGVDLSVFCPPQAGHSKDPQAAFSVLSQRAWEPVYRVPLVLDAFARAAAVAPRLRLKVAGSGSEAEAVRLRASESSLTGRVDLVGHVTQKDMADLCRDSDIAVSAAAVDGSSISLLEAFACGLPVVATDSPSNREWIVPGVTGWLVDPTRGEDLAAAMLAAAADPASLTAMRAACRAVAVERADWAKGQASLYRLYEQVARQAA